MMATQTAIMVTLCDLLISKKTIDVALFTSIRNSSYSQLRRAIA